MPIKVTCPKCQGVLHAPDDAGGKRGKCPTCGTVLAIPADSPAVTSGSPSSGAESPASGEAPGRPGAFGLRPPAPPPTEEGGALPGPGRGSSFGGPMPKVGGADRPPMGPGRPIPTPPQPTGQGGPFAKPGRAAPPVGQDPELAERLAKAWKRARRGLLGCQFAGFLFLLSCLGIYGISIAELYGVQLPDQMPGYLGQPELGSEMEIKYAVVFVPVLLGLVLMLFGLLSFRAVPKRSLCKGMATLTVLSYLLTFIGAVMFLVPTLGGIYFGQPFARIPRDLLLEGDLNAMIQRGGLFLFVVFGLLTDLYFLGTCGRLAAHLGNDRLASRTTRRVFLGGAALFLTSLWFVGQEIYPKLINEWLDANVWPQWAKAGEHQPVVILASASLAVLIIWVLYTRLLGAARQAMTEWLDQNDPAV